MVIGEIRARSVIRSKDEYTINPIPVVNLQLLLCPFMKRFTEEQVVCCQVLFVKG
jgi:hypothetical protein